VAWAWLVGVACQLQQAVLWPMWVYTCGALVCGATGVGQLLRPAPWPAARRWGLWFVLGWGMAFSLTGARAVWVKTGALDARWEGASVQVVGVVASMPQISDSGLRARFQVESAQPIVPIPLPEQIWLSWPQAHDTTVTGALPTLRAGDRWALTVRLKAPHGHLNPHGGDQELWFWEHGLQAVGTVRQGYDVPGPRWLASTPRYRIERWRQSARDAIVRRIPDPAAAGVVAALVVGDQSAIQAADWEVFRLTGVAHLMAISGMHITGLAWLASVILQCAWRHSHRLWARWPQALRWAPQRLGPWVGCWVALGYSVFSGWGVPAQRTVWMLAVVVLLRSVGRQWPWGRTWRASPSPTVTSTTRAALTPCGRHTVRHFTAAVSRSPDWRA
jgi:competence protein ComEC